MLASLAQPIYFAVIHLLFASLVWAAAWLLTRSSGASATAKYWIWVITSLYFLVPAGSVVDGLWGGQPSWAAPLAPVGALGLWLADHAVVVGSIWLAGALAMALRLALRLRGSSRTQANAVTRSIDGIPIRVGTTGPVVDGIVRTRITIPGDLDAVLTEAELAAVLRHEVTHAQRRDNLIALVHELALCMLWFHPLVWLAGSQLALYRELSCDESVLREARGADLISALAKLSGRDDASPLQASVSSMLSYRLALLAEPRSRSSGALAIAMFAATVVAGFVLTVGHTACCFRY